MGVRESVSEGASIFISFFFLFCPFSFWVYVGSVWKLNPKPTTLCFCFTGFSNFMYHTNYSYNI